MIVDKFGNVAVPDKGEITWVPPKNVVATRSPRVAMVARRVKQARMRLHSLLIIANPSYVSSPEWPVGTLYLNMPKAVIPKTQEQFEQLNEAIQSLHRWTAVASALLKTYEPWQAEWKMLNSVLQ